MGPGAPFGTESWEANRAGESRLRHVLSIAGFDTSILPICKDSLGWMFNKLDMNYDLLLDHSEINAIYLDKYEPCIKPLFNSCDSFKDGKLSNNEWCYCFQKPGGKAGGKWGPVARVTMLGREGPSVMHWGRKTQLESNTFLHLMAC